MVQFLCDGYKCVYSMCTNTQLMKASGSQNVSLSFDLLYTMISSENSLLSLFNLVMIFIM